jgi:hypothetical protein
MIGLILRTILGPMLSIAEKWLDNQKDLQRLEHVTKRVAMVEDTKQRVTKWQYAILRLPLFCGEIAAVGYFAAVMIDSTFASDWLNPLELPAWFQPHFGTALASIFGIAAAERIFRR